MSDEETPAVEGEQPGFVPSETFAGAREGYKFEVSAQTLHPARLAKRASDRSPRSHHRLPCHRAEWGPGCRVLPGPGARGVPGE